MRASSICVGYYSPPIDQRFHHPNRDPWNLESFGAFSSMGAARRGGQLGRSTDSSPRRAASKSCVALELAAPRDRPSVSLGIVVVGSASARHADCSATCAPRRMRLRHSQARAAAGGDQTWRRGDMLRGEVKRGCETGRNEGLARRFG